MLQQLVPGLDDESRGVKNTSLHCPVRQFAEVFLVHDPTRDMTCKELLDYYSELVATGEVAPLSKGEFLRALPAAMAAVYGTKKRHTIKRGGQNLRGFRGIRINDLSAPIPVPNI